MLQKAKKSTDPDVASNLPFQSQLRLRMAASCQAYQPLCKHSQLTYPENSMQPVHQAWHVARTSSSVSATSGYPNSTSTSM